MSWKIRHKDGLPLTDANGKEIELHSLTYDGEWMGKCSVTADISNEAPVKFGIGDYIEYRGEKFELNYDPGKLKQARKDACGDSFVYESVKWDSLADELARAEFLDVVLGKDNQVHYTALPTFSFYVETLDDLLDRLQANMDEQVGEGLWKIYSRNWSRSHQRGCDKSRWEEMYGGDADSDDTGVEDVHISSASISVDRQTVWEGLSLVNTQFDVNFVVRNREVFVGTAGLPTRNIFGYGKGNGLYAIEQAVDTEQAIVTRMRAYGSSKNLPTRYYATLNMEVWTTADNVFEIVSASGKRVEFVADLKSVNLSAYFRTVVSGSPGKYSVRVRAGGVTLAGVVQKSTSSVTSDRCMVTVSTGDGQSLEDVDAFEAALRNDERVYFVSGVTKANFPDNRKDYATENLPDNMSCDRLMLPGFPNESLSDWWSRQPDATRHRLNPTGAELRFSPDKYRPWVESASSDMVGVRQGSVYFDTEDVKNKVDEIYPTLEEMTRGGTRVDVIAKGSDVDDNGVFKEGQTVPGFTLELPPELDIDINDLKNSDFSVTMKDGMCAGRSFKVGGSVKKDGCWVLTMQRAEDGGVYYPYKDFQISQGDHYVLTGIDLPDEYVEAASEKLLAYAIVWLLANDHTRHTYSPKIDEIFMARQHDEAVADPTGTLKSLHDTLKEGDVMQFADDDLGIEGQVVIDRLTIRETDGGIPTYEVALRDDKEVGTLQRMQEQISSLTSGNGAGGGATAAQIKELVASEGGKYFLSKTRDDVAQGAIRFMERMAAEKGLRLGGEDSRYGMDGEGQAVLGDVVVDRVHDKDSGEADRVIVGGKGFELYMGADGRSHLWVDTLSVRARAFFAELEIRRVSYAGGTTILSNAGSTIQSVEAVTDASGETVAYKCWAVADDGSTRTANWWKPGMMALSQTLNVSKAGATTNAGNRRYWRLVVDAGQSVLDDGKTYDYVVLSNVKVFGGGDLVVPVGTSMSSLAAAADARLDVTADDGGTSITGRMFYGYEPTADGGAPDVPDAGDVIVQVGDQIRWNTAGNAIVLRTQPEDGSGSMAPSISMYHGIGALRPTGVVGDDGLEGTSVWQWKTLTAVLSPEQTLVNSENFKFFVGSPDNIVDPVAVWHEVTSASGDVITRKADGTVSPQHLYLGVTKHVGGTSTGLKGFKLYVEETLDNGAVKTQTLRAGSTDMYVLYETKDYVSGVTVEYDDGGQAVRKSIVVVKDGVDGADGKDGVATEASVEPGTITLQAATDATGNALADCSTGNTAQIKVMRGGEDITAQCSFLMRSASGYVGTAGGDGCTAKVDGNGMVTITAVGSTAVEGRDISLTSASATVRVNDGTNVHYVTVHVSVSVSAVWGSLVADQKKFEAKYTEITDGLNDRVGDVENGVAQLPTRDELTRMESRITQTARNIALKVGQTVVGRKNLFVGSALRKRGEGADIGSQNGSGIVWGGWDGWNAFRAVVTCPGGEQQWVVVDNGTVTEGGTSVNIRIPKKGASYTVSCQVRGDEGVVFGVEAFWKDAAADERGKQQGRIGAASLKVTEESKDAWQMLTLTFSVPGDAGHDYMEVCASATHTVADATKVGYISCVMVAEGDEYDGYSLAEGDYDYIGGNMLDGTRALAKDGNLEYVTDDVKKDGYGGCSVAHAVEATGVDGACTEVLQWMPTLKQGKDYVLQFAARGSGCVSCYMYDGEGEGEQSVWVDKSEESLKASGYAAMDGHAPMKLSAEWRIYMVHWRVVGSNVPRRVLIRCNAGSEAWVSQPKLEEGATATAWTDSKTGYTEDRAMVAKMLETGLDIEHKKMTLTADKTVFRTNSGEEVAVFDASGLNANLVKAKRLETTNVNGASVKIEDGLMEVFGTNGVANIRFGVDDEGQAILSYYDKTGKWLYDLGPNKLDAGTQSGSKLERIDIGYWTAGTIGTENTYKVGGDSYKLLTAANDIDVMLFGRGLGAKPFENKQPVLTLYRYTAGRQQNAIVADSRHSLTAALAKEADGRYFTSSQLSDGTTLKNLATGKFFGMTALVDESPLPLTTTSAAYSWPKYSMRYLVLDGGQVSQASGYGVGLLYSKDTKVVMDGATVIESIEEDE